MAIGILGMGVSGIAALKLAQSKGIEAYAINSGAVPTWSNYSQLMELVGRKYLVEQDDAYELKIDEIVLSPGIARETPLIEHFVLNEVKVISEIEFAARYIDVPIIGITGTNGKTTTCTLLQRAIENCGKKAFLGGNIGIALSLMPLSNENYDYAVVELSSFQLESIEEFSPQIACILNISQSHSERYDDPRDYAAAKFNISKNLKNDDFFIYPQECFVIEDRVSELECNKVELTSECHKKTVVELDFSNQNAVGAHYIEMYTFIKTILNILNLKYEDVLNNMIESFPGLEHRIEFVKEIDGKVFYNDSKSTNIAATINAINSFDGEVQLIFGGQLRDENISFVSQLFKYEDILTKIILFGESSEVIENEYGERFSFQCAMSFSEAISYCDEGVILYSPAFPSFDMFKDYKDRGEKFKLAVNKLT